MLLLLLHHTLLPLPLLVIVVVSYGHGRSLVIIDIIIVVIVIVIIVVVTEPGLQSFKGGQARAQNMVCLCVFVQSSNTARDHM